MAESRQVPCKVCGKLFTPCNKTSRELGMFNWREVACSPQCGMEYLEQVTAARSQKDGGSGQEKAE
ncbi:hypothetical protein [uncultured Neglectibacter sp.]|uniref:hypothetical protein n=1 Tax=uncultured Neglectibacter sp. TaxID=1924108 RepID=UPI0034DEF88F